MIAKLIGLIIVVMIAIIAAAADALAPLAPPSAAGAPIVGAAAPVGNRENGAGDHFLRFVTSAGARGIKIIVVINAAEIDGLLAAAERAPDARFILIDPRPLSVQAAPMSSCIYFSESATRHRLQYGTDFFGADDRTHPVDFDERGRLSPPMGGKGHSSAGDIIAQIRADVKSRSPRRFYILENTATPAMLRVWRGERTALMYEPLRRHASAPTNRAETSRGGKKYRYDAETAFDADLLGDVTNGASAEENGDDRIAGNMGFAAAVEALAPAMFCGLYFSGVRPPSAPSHADLRAFYFAASLGTWKPGEDAEPTIEFSSVLAESRADETGGAYIVVDREKGR